MVAGLGTTRIAIVVAVAVAVCYVWAVSGRGRWYATLSERFVYGVPWGTLISITGVVGFYLFAQSGLTHWSDPATMPFRSWSYSYLTGMLSAGFAHAGPDHLLGNMVGTVVLAPLVEYAWSHYPPRIRDDTAPRESGFRVPPPGDLSGAEAGVEGYEAPASARLHERPWVRALVIFPLAVFVVSIVTSLFALGWSLGFSGTVFAFGGFAVVYMPLAAIVATVGFAGVGVIVRALREPVLRATAEPGTPGPPSWFGVNVQAHLLGFLIGVLLAFWLLHHRNERRAPGKTFLAVAVFGFFQQLWSLALSQGEEFVRYQGIGTVFVILLTIAITVAVTGGAKTSGSRSASSRRLSRPSLSVSLPGSTQKIFLAGLVVVTLFVAGPPSLFSNLGAVDADSVPETATVEIEDYTVTYAEDVPHGRVSGNESGVIVISERRAIWTSAVDKNQLAHSGEATVVVGGVGWRDTVTANRTGWEVTGGETAYVVDLEYEGERRRAFTSEPAEADVTIANQTIAVVPDDEQFLLNVTREGTPVSDVPVPEVNESVTVDDLRLVAEPDEGTVAVFAEQDGTRVQIATREEF